MMRLTFITITLLLASVSLSRGADLLLRERVAPAGSVVRLGELVTIQGATPADEQRLSQLPLMPAPAPGTQQTVRAQEIRDLLVALGVDLTQLRFDGANRITIGRSVHKSLGAAQAKEPMLFLPDSLSSAEAAAQRLRPRQRSGFRVVTEAPGRRPWKPRNVTGSELATLKKELIERITQYVRQQTGDEQLHAMGVELASRNATSLSQATGSIDVATTGEPTLGRQRFLISFPTTEGPVRFPVLSEIQRATPVVVAKRAIARGSTITAADVELKPLLGDQRLRANETAKYDIEEVLGQEAGRAVRAGQPLTDGNCLPPLMIRRGELVDVFASSGGIRVRRKLKARVDGRLGDTIDAESPDGEQRLQARVVGFRELAVAPTGSGSEAYLSSLPGGRNVR